MNNQDSVAVIVAEMRKELLPLNVHGWPQIIRAWAKRLAALTREAAPQASGGDGALALELAAQFDWWLRFNADCHAKDGTPVHDDMHVIAPEWPRRGTIKVWIDLLRRLATTDSAIQSQQGATGGAVLRQFVEGLDCECDPDYSTQTCGRCQALAHPQAAGSAPVGVEDDWADVALTLSNEVLPPMQCPDTPDRWLAAMRRHLAATPAVSVGDAKDAERWNFYVHAMTSDCGVARAAIQRQAFPAHTKEAWDACIDKAMSEVLLPEPANDAALEKERAE